MKIKQLIKELESFDEGAEIMILDGFNGGGYPREINLGPMNHKISKEDENETADCEDKIGNNVVVIGYGCY